MNSKQEIINKIIINLNQIKEKKPLVHHITNFVTANDQANITLAIGALPIMAQHSEELKGILSKADSLLLNTGTIDEKKADILYKAAEIASKYHVPVVLDPVGVGVSTFRREIVSDLIKEGWIDVIKGNTGEIVTLIADQKINNDVNRGISGVDYLEEDIVKRNKQNNFYNIIKKFSFNKGLISIVTGKVDLITDGKQVIEIYNGSDFFKKITGSGCMAGSLVASFLAVEKKSMLAATGGILLMGLAGEIAADNVSGPGTFHKRLFDTVYNIKRENLQNTRIVIKNKQDII